MKYYYGVSSKEEIFLHVKHVCDVLGYGKNKSAHILLLGTLAAETNLGTFRDNTNYSAGNGISQFDRLPFEDIQSRVCHYHKDWVETIKEEFDIDISTVTWHSLHYSPLASIIFARLLYKLIPDEIPSELKYIAKYWKKHYNTELGKGSEDEFIKKFHEYIIIQNDLED